MQSRSALHRMPVFERMRTLLKQCVVELRVMHGDSLPAERPRRDGGSLPGSRIAVRNSAIESAALLPQRLMNPLAVGLAVLDAALG